MNPRPILIATCVAICFVVGAYLVGSLYFDPSREDTTPIVTTDKPGPTAKGHINGDVWHDETVTVKKPVPDIVVPHPVQFTVPLTDADRQILDSPLPSPDENGNPRYLGELAPEQKERVAFEFEVAGREYRAITAEMTKLNADLKSGRITLEDFSGRIEVIGKRLTILDERYDLLPQPKWE